MAYTKTTWKNGDIITADLLNKMEEGIASGGNASDKLGDLASLTTTAKNTLVAAINELKSYFSPGVSFNESNIIFTDPDDPTKQALLSVSPDSDKPLMFFGSPTSESESLEFGTSNISILSYDDLIGMGYIYQSDEKKYGFMISKADGQIMAMGDLSALFADIDSREKYGILSMGPSANWYFMITPAKIILNGPDSGIFIGDLSAINAPINDNEEKYGIMIGGVDIFGIGLSFPQKFFKFPKITSSGETLATQEWVNENSDNAKMKSHHIHIKLTTKNSRIWNFWFIIYSYESKKVNTLNTLSNILTFGTIPISCQGNLITPDTIDEYMVTADLNKNTNGNIYIHYSTNKQYYYTFQLDQSATIDDIIR